MKFLSLLLLVGMLSSDAHASRAYMDLDWTKKMPRNDSTVLDPYETLGIQVKVPNILGATASVKAYGDSATCQIKFAKNFGEFTIYRILVRTEIDEPDSACSFSYRLPSGQTGRVVVTAVGS
jgi:hypothetical protein